VSSLFAVLMTTAGQIAQGIGVTQVQVSRLLSRVLSDLRTELASPRTNAARKRAPAGQLRNGKALPSSTSGVGRPFTRGGGVR